MRYRLLEHTADAMVEVHGTTLGERYANAAYALFDQITDVTKVEPKGEVKIVLSADTREQLLVDFLRSSFSYTTLRSRVRALRGD
jgi:SHS2 domain-containing protein